MSVIEGLNRAWALSVGRQSTLNLVIDGAQAEGSQRQLERWGVPYLSLFEATPEEQLIEIAPLLVPVNGLDENARAKLFAWAEDLAYRSPMLSWVESALSPQHLAAHLRRYHVVGLSEGQSMLMRWYDTRILPIWLACLSAPQSLAFAAGTLQWQYVDRSGNIETPLRVDSPPGLPAPPAYGQPMIVLDDTQFAALVGAADLDAMLARLRRVIPDEIKQVPKATLTRFVGRHMQAAADAGLNDIDRQAQYVLLALYTSGKGLEQPEFKAFMKTAPAGFNEFADGIAGLPERVWNSGPPLWDALPANSSDGSPLTGGASA